MSKTESIIYRPGQGPIELTRRQAEIVLQCLGRAIVEGAFKDCVVPDIGEKAAAMLQAKLDA
jgi:hypothetical protein